MADPIRRLTQLLAKLPGVGEKTATRLAFFIMRAPESYAQELGQTIIEARTSMRLCSQCCGLTTEETCSLCADERRDRSTICVVAQPQELLAIEKAGTYRGLYHVLHGVLAPLDGIGPEDLKISELLRRLQTSPVHEVILAIAPTVEGEATALYLAKLLKGTGIRVTRLASGVPIGGELEYTDSATLSRALESRREL